MRRSEAKNKLRQQTYENLESQTQNTKIPHSNYRGGNTVYENSDGWIRIIAKQILASRQVVESHVPPNLLWSCWKSTVQGYKIKVTQTKKGDKKSTRSQQLLFFFVFFLRQLQARNSPPQMVALLGGSRVPTTPRWWAFSFRNSFICISIIAFCLFHFSSFGVFQVSANALRGKSSALGVGLFDTKRISTLGFFWTPEIPRPKNFIIS